MNGSCLMDGKEQIDQADHTGSKEEGVCLNIADLKESEDESKKPDNGRASLHEDSIDEPAINKGTETGKTTLNVCHRPVVDGIDVKAVGQQRNPQGIP